MSFWSQLETDLGASSADFARAYVIAHEYGHHIQTLTGLSEQVRTAQQRASGQAEASIPSPRASAIATLAFRNAATVSNGEVAPSGDRSRHADGPGHRGCHVAAPSGRDRSSRKASPRHLGPAGRMAAARL
jgi:hypothetical protein